MVGWCSLYGEVRCTNLERFITTLASAGRHVKFGQPATIYTKNGEIRASNPAAFHHRLQ